MSYTDVFGGNLIFPSQVSYLALTTAIDVQLQWPTEQQIEGMNVVADIIDVDATAPGLSIDMPDAQIASTGNKVTFNNIGANSYLVRDVTGGTIQTVQPGEQWVLTLTDNSTDMGAWTTFQLGASVAVASASALAGAGIKAIGVLLNQKIDSDVQAATPFTLVDGDRATCQIYTSGAGICNLPSAGVVGNDWFVMLRNSGSGTLTVTPPAGTIDGSATVNLDPNGSTFIFTDGVNWFTIGLTVASTIAFDFVSLPVPGSGDFVLSGANLNRISYRFTGALTGNRRIVVPNTTQQYWVDNQTTGAFTLSVSTAAQVTPPTVNQGDTVIFYSDATDVINAVNTAAIALPVLIAQGGTGATTAPNALLNLGAAASALLINTLADSGLSGGGDLTADRTLILDVNNLDTTPSPALGDFIAFEDIDDNITYKATLTDIFALNPSGITIEDEGTPLATVADTLDFTGGIVTASGVGTTKTIDIPIAASTAASRTLRADGSGGWVEEDNVRIETNGLINVAGIGSGIRFLTVLDTFTESYALALINLGGQTVLRLNVVGTPSTTYEFSVQPAADFDLPIRLEEQAAAPAVFNPAGANYGQIWVKDEAPNILAFTDDDGDSYVVSNQLKFKNVSTTRGVTGVADDPQLSGWALSPGYWRFYGSIEFGVTPFNGGIDLNWSVVGGAVGADFGQIITRDDDLGVTVGNAIEASFIPTTGGDTVIPYAIRNDATRAYIHGAIEVTAATVVGFQWGPRLAANLSMGEASWILFQKMDV